MNLFMNMNAKKAFFLIVTAIAVLFTLVSTGSLVTFAAHVNDNPKLLAMIIAAALAEIFGLTVTSMYHRKLVFGKMF